uniref:Uncharacterized protein n=1 Tax=Anguilla anguilla TaxID=7936 RepID=A0A0E9V931_ANGAN
MWESVNGEGKCLKMELA